MEGLIAVGGIVLSVLTFFAGERRADRRHERAAIQARHEVIRNFAVVSRSILAELGAKLEHLDRVLRNSGELTVYVVNEGPVLSENDQRQLRTCIENGGKLPQACANTWYDAVTRVKAFHEEHDRLRRLEPLGALPEGPGNAEGYRRTLMDAKDAFRTALLKTRTHAAEDSKREITNLLGMY